MERYDREGKRDFWLENVPRIAVIYISRPTNRLSIRRKEIKAAVVTDFGQAPAYGDFREPVAGEGETIVRVCAAPLSLIVKALASGRHLHQRLPGRIRTWRGWRRH